MSKFFFDAKRIFYDRFSSLYAVDMFLTYITVYVTNSLGGSNISPN